MDCCRPERGLFHGPLPETLDAARLKQAVDNAFEPEAGMTAAFVVTWKGLLAVEQRGEGYLAFPRRARS